MVRIIDKYNTIDHINNQINLNLLHQLIQVGVSRKNLPVRLLGIGIKLKQKNVLKELQLSLFD